jgi:hypothetical protein
MYSTVDDLSTYLPSVCTSDAELFIYLWRHINKIFILLAILVTIFHIVLVVILRIKMGSRWMEFYFKALDLINLISLKSKILKYQGKQIHR